MTVNAGAVALIVSTKDTGTCSSATRPRTTVRPRRMPTTAMSRTKCAVLIIDLDGVPGLVESDDLLLLALFDGEDVDEDNCTPVPLFSSSAKPPPRIDGLIATVVAPDDLTPRSR